MGIFRRNCEHICATFFETTELDVVNHNYSIHATLEGTQNVYIATLLHDGYPLRVIIHLEDMVATSTSIEDCYKYIERRCHTEIFKFTMKKYELER